MTTVIVVGDSRADPANLEMLRDAAPDIRSLTLADSVAEMRVRAAASAPPVVGILHGERMSATVASAARRLADTVQPGGLIVAVPSVQRGTLVKALWQGARGCVLTDSPVEELITAIRAVAAGHLFLPSALLHELADTLLMLAFRRGRNGPGPDLTDRELDVLSLLALGHTNSEIAARLLISESTVHSHVLNILRKMNARNRTEAVAMVYRQGILHDARAVRAASGPARLLGVSNDPDGLLA